MNLLKYSNHRLLGPGHNKFEIFQSIFVRTTKIASTANVIKVIGQASRSNQAIYNLYKL